MNDIKDYFKDWTIDKYTAKDSTHELWICTWFIGFGDYRYGKTPLLFGLSIKERWALWCELKREIRERNKL